MALSGALLAGPARAQTLPDGPVTLLVPYTPGGGPDILARLIAPPLQALFGQPVVVENRAGASGNIGTQAVARAAPDGRMLLVQANTFVMNPSLFRQVPYDPIAGFTPIIQLSRGDMVLAVNPDVPARTAREFADLARRQVLDYCSPGVGTPHHLGMALFAQVAGVTMNHIPYRGAAPAVQDLIGKRVGAQVMPVHVARPLAEQGQIRLLAVGSATRSAVAPDVPTVAEAGFPGAEVDLWFGLLGPAGLPPALVTRINQAVNAWLGEATAIAALKAQGMVPVGGTPQAFADLLQRDLLRWAAVIKANAITAD